MNIDSPLMKIEDNYLTIVALMHRRKVSQEEVWEDANPIGLQG